jgi:hypothetical protein
MNAEDYRELDMRVAELEDEVKRLKHALNAIAFPIKHMTEEAEAQGYKIDGRMAMQLADSPAYLMGIAKEALNVK